MKIIGLIFSALAILGMLTLSKGALFADVIAPKGKPATLIEQLKEKKPSDLSTQDTKYFAEHQNSIQVAGEDTEGWKLLGGTVLVVIFIIAMASLAISK